MAVAEPYRCRLRLVAAGRTTAYTTSFSPVSSILLLEHFSLPDVRCGQRSVVQHEAVELCFCYAFHLHVCGLLGQRLRVTENTNIHKEVKAYFKCK